MSRAPHNLQLAGQPVRFDDRGYRWALREAGTLGQLKGLEGRLLFLIYCLADAEGFADVPTGWCADHLGVTKRAARDARKNLEALGLLVREGQSQRYKSVGQFRLVTPEAPRPGLSEDGLDGICSGEVQFRGGSTVPPKGEVQFPQRRTKKEACSKEADAPLYERGPYDPAAAALLTSACGVSARVAAGLVGQYRPTLGEIQNVVDNIRARNHAAAVDSSVKAIRSPAGFATHAIRHCNYALDERVITARRRDKAKADVAARKAQDVIDTQQAQTSDAAKKQADALIWASLGPAQRRDLRTRALQRLKPWQRAIHQDHADDNPVVRALILGQYARDHQD